MGGVGVDLNLAIVGAGAAGTSVADAMKRARPEWSIVLFERTNRIGGRLMSVKIEGLEHPIELGGMRFLTSHARIASMVDELGLRSHPFDTTATGRNALSPRCRTRSSAGADLG
jgi:protoporphyrinogen oxidase